MEKSKEEFIADKMKILVGKEGYSKAQAYMISLSYWEREKKPKAQQAGQFTGERFGIPPEIDYSFSAQLPTQPNPFENTGYANYAQNLEQKYPIDKLDDYSQYNVDQNFRPSEGLKPMVAEQTSQSIYQPNVDTTQKPEIYNPFTGISLEQSLYRAGQGLGEKDPWKAASGIGLSALKVGRIGLSGYATGKEDARIAEEMQRKQFEDMRRPQIYQQGGETEISNAAVLTGNFIVDQNQGNVILENEEYVKDNKTNNIQKVVGDTHKEGGVQTTLEDSKILSDYTKIGAKNAKELKEKYNLSLKKTDTFAKAMDKMNKKLGVDELVEEQTEYIEKLGKNETIKSQGTKKVNDEFLNKEITEKENKLNELKGAQNFVFEDIFARQEAIPKLGNGELLDAKGRPMETPTKEVAQQGGRTYTTTDQSYNAQRVGKVLNSEASDDNMGINLKKIKSIQSGVTNDKLGNGYYIYYDKLPTEQGFDPNKNREFVTQEAYRNVVLRAPAYQEYMRNLNAPIPQQIVSEEFQQGGRIEALANKYGISPQRAQELMMFQQGGKKHCQEGGIQSEQEEAQEGEESNYQEEQGEISLEQVVQAFAQATQQDPQQIIAQLQQLPPEEQQAAIQQMMQALQQGQQTPTEEQAEGQMSNPQEEGQEEVMQQGGKKYYQEAGGYDPDQPYGKDWTKANKKLMFERALQQARIAGYEGKLNKNDFEKDSAWGELQKYVTEKRPSEVEQYARDTRLTAKHIGDIKATDPDIFKTTGIPMNKPNEGYSEEEAQVLSDAAKKSTKLPKTFWTEGFNDALGAYRFPVMGTNLQARGIGQTPQSQITAPSMARFASTPEAATQETIVPEAEQAQATQTTTSQGRTVMPNLPVDFLLPPSAMQAINKPYVPLGRIQPVKLTAMLAETERQRQTSLEALRATGLPPQIQESLSAGQLATSQGAANEAIAKTEQFNAQNQFQTDQFNIGQAAKEDLMNTQYAQDYQDKMMQTMANQERDMRRYYNELNAQNRANFNYVDRRNIANQAFSNFSTSGSDVTYNSSTPTANTDVNQGMISKAQWDAMTPEEQATYRDQQLKYMQNANAMKNYQKT